MKYTWLYLPVLVIIAIPVTYWILTNLPGSRKSRVRAYFAVTDKCADVLMCWEPDVIYAYIQEYKAAYAAAADGIPSKERAHYRADLRELEEHLAEAEQEDFDRKAGEHLQNFMDDFYSLKHEARLNKPEKNEQLRRSCVREWVAYYAVPLDAYHTRILPAKIFKETLGSDYEPCMADRTKLERKLDSFLRSAKKA